MLKMLIADSAEEFRMALTAQLAGSYVIRCCQQGKEALELIRSFKPDVVVLDLMMPELDGISVLQQAVDSGARPVVLATTRILNDYIQTAVTKLGVGYLMVKPCDIMAVAARVSDLTEPLSGVPMARPDNRTIVSNALRNLGIPTKLRGYTYLREAILIAIDRSGLMVTKEIYPAVGHLCDASPDQVERSIRSAVAAAFQRRDEQTWRRFFQVEPDGELLRPSNGAFIATLAELLKDESFF